jgi:hypothetical protein
MTETYIGTLPVSHWGASLAKLLLTLIHLGLWFACLWLLLHFQWGHALGLAVVLWLTLSLTVLPIIFTKAEETAKRHSHTLEVRNTGTHMPSSSGTRVAIDRFEVIP